MTKKFSILNFQFSNKNTSGFTLIELLVTIMIIGILVTIATFGLRQAQSSAKDARRKADLEEIAVGLELYRSECSRYPATLGATLVGSPPPSGCTGTYITDVPIDPTPPRVYAYSTNPGGTTITLCAALEQAPNPPLPPAALSSCASCGGSACNWRISRP